MPYLIILIVVLITSPFVLKLAQSQKKEDKRNLKNLFLLILIFQVISGFLNWENFSVGRSGFELSLTYPNSFLGLFFIISLLQIILLLTLKSFSSLVIVLNFINTVILFFGMIRLGQITGIQAVSWANVGAAFAVLLGNVIGLAFVNKDNKLLKKYYCQKGRAYRQAGFSMVPLIIIIGLLTLGGIIYIKPKTTGMTRNQAVENVKKLPEVQDYLKRIPNGKVEVDNELGDEYNVHVYEVKNGHTATFNWYHVSIKSGEVRPEFETNGK